MEVFITCFLACCCAIVFMPIAGWYALAFRAERCVLRNMAPASKTEQLTAHLAVLESAIDCPEALDVRSYKWFLQAVTLLQCQNTGWHSVTTMAGQEKPRVSPITRTGWILHSVVGGAEGDCF
ncbi:MAG TPA: hypothetical protein VEC57_15860 [Candidatus Limnocylindrales bacterium]|nr:hypothetical protein [Candidatus Limnocylindrales bacterium]